MVRAPYIDSKGMKKGAWSEDEDKKLSSFVKQYGHANWRMVPKYAGLARCGKSCRLRWVNYLKPGIIRGNFTKQEQDLAIKLHAQLGNKWSAIATKLPGRTDNEIKNFWHTHMDKHRRRNPISPAANKIKSHAYSKNSSKNYQVLEAFEITFSENEYTLSFDTNINNPPSLPNITKSPQQVDSSWAVDIFQASDTKSDCQNDHSISPLMLEEDFLYPEFQYYSELSSSENSSYLTALDWIGDDDLSIMSSEYVAPPVEGSFWNESSSAMNTKTVLEEEGGIYDTSLQYFDYGMDLFS